ncbi:ribosome small subunit-dependent GTPase A [Rhodanobacter spathiphylli]|uniref:Small ribosomal subunit biogenesis GTPase RsgA n=1 Tax=Rhodanobacter spathiphylli B39 TaxID=1163407 RepID=I4VXD8_9GAMM|nr:ribosome small subunit-dependent GTPase A [Rhodanobacter spathiphylli]EIL91879.1 GTPase RsgA [Rhodanobacter spathiphylli B39]
MHSQTFTLFQLGWRLSYSHDLTLQDFEAGYPARVVGVHRNALSVLSARGAASVILSAAVEPAITVGDWLLLEMEAPRVLRLLARQSLIARIAAGSERRLQPIAANLDTLFIVTSCNDDFNLSRLERYLTLAFEAGVEPVIVLTKADLCGDVGSYLDAVRTIAPAVACVPIDATSTACAEPLAAWLGGGQTVAFVGSSGVGKSTLANTLVGSAARVTGGIREGDARGRHTTTARGMFALPSGAWVIDTPGMRELRVGAVETGMNAAFDDIERLAAQCRFHDCRHQGDRGCAVEQAVAAGTLDGRRLANYRKLQREAAQAARSTKERREHDRHYGVLNRHAQRLQREKKGRDY